MHAVLQQIRRTIQRHGLCPPGARLLIGLSGGSDSVALSRALLDLGPTSGVTVAGLAHFNHRLRPDASRDEAFCRGLGSELGLPFVTEGADVAAFAEAQRLSIEDAARRLRYDFLERTATGLAADRIAVGHTMDDQAETFLLKLMRGAGPGGLGGVYPERGRVIRPLLDVSRDELRRYLDSIAQPWVEDETNADLSNPRNRLRHVGLPELDATYGGSTRASIARAAGLAREDGQWLDELAAERYRVLAQPTQGQPVQGRQAQDCVQFDVRALAAEPMPLRRRVLLAAMRSRAGGREVGRDHVEAALAVLDGHARAADVPGSRWELRGSNLVLYDKGSGRSDTLK